MTEGGMTLGNMRGLGPRSLDVTCKACGHHTTVNVDGEPDDVTVPSLGPRMRCSKCGQLGASVRPDWTKLHGAPPPPQS
jgi:ribosomal protein S27E